MEATDGGILPPLPQFHFLDFVDLLSYPRLSGGSHMKQEHRLVAEVYRWLAPFVDTQHDIYISPDGQAAKTAVAAGRFKDPDIPDLWFTLVGSHTPTYIEAKVVDDDGTVLVMQSQITAWRNTGGTGMYKPHYWVATNRSFKKFYFWHHADFATLHSTASQNNIPLRPPASAWNSSTQSPSLPSRYCARFRTLVVRPARRLLRDVHAVPSP